MDKRKLRGLLDTYRDAGVAKVSLADDLRPTSLEYWPPSTLAPVPTGDVEGADESWKPAIPDLQGALTRINKAYQTTPKGKTQ